MVYKIDMQYSNYFFYCFFVEVIEKPKWGQILGGNYMEKSSEKRIHILTMQLVYASQFEEVS